MSTRILALVGSLRAGSYNRQLAEAAVKHAPGGVEIDIFEGLSDVAFYNEDIDRPGAVAAADRLRAEVQSADALLLVTPEYNGTIPAVLKNAIDWASRPFGASAITGKPVAVIGTSGGRHGGAWAHEDARKAARIAGASVLDDVTMSVPRAATHFAVIPPAGDEEIADALPTILATLAAAIPPHEGLVQES
jgi:NAD(P)H-dependent FMN reductase